jgi:restriction system protein
MVIVTPYRPKVRPVPLPRSKSAPTLLLQSALLDLGPRTSQGQIVQAVTPPWLQLCREIEQNPDILFEFVKNPRKFEEFIAGVYERDGWEVELTPLSGDLGRDVVATKPGVMAIRVLDQCKAFSPGHVVTANDVRAMAGVLLRDQNVSKGIVTTTSTFAVGITKEFVDLIPYRLDLRDGQALEKWLRDLVIKEKE